VFKIKQKTRTFKLLSKINFCSAKRHPL